MCKTKIIKYSTAIDIKFVLNILLGKVKQKNLFTLKEFLRSYDRSLKLLQFYEEKILENQLNHSEIFGEIAQKMKSSRPKQITSDLDLSSVKVKLNFTKDLSDWTCVWLVRQLSDDILNYLSELHRNDANFVDEFSDDVTHVFLDKDSDLSDIVGFDSLNENSELVFL